MKGQKTYILGISCFYHDAAASLLEDGRIIAATEEERFTRVKHDKSFPQNAIDYCLSYGDITSDEIDYVGFYEKPILKFDRILQSSIENFPHSFQAFYDAIPSWVNEKLRVKAMIKRSLAYTGEVLFVDHHTSHAASAYFPSPFEDSAILTVDGVGEWKTTALYHGRGDKLTPLKEIHFPHSIGLLYSAITAYLGFKVNDDEYKVMGLAAYGKPAFLDEFRLLVEVLQDGSFRLSMEYFDYAKSDRMFNRRLESLLGPSRKEGEPISQRHKDIAATVQHVTEDIVFKATAYLKDLTGSRNLCVAGGVGLNSVMNGKLRKNGDFDNIFIQPAAGDSGGAMGVALFIYHQLMNNGGRHALNHAFLGQNFSTGAINGVLECGGADYERMDEERLSSQTAKILSEDKVVGWFQGRMEWGPRALGNRSILASPCKAGMRDMLNSKVKHREMFRPFAASVPVEDAPEFFDIDGESPYMLFVFDVKDEKRGSIPAVTHVDGTCRVQTVSPEANPLFHRLLKEFGKLTGVPVLLNTSFNVRGEPIVCSPNHAYECFMKTDIDYLVMGEFLVQKKRTCESRVER